MSWFRLTLAVLVCCAVALPTRADEAELRRQEGRLLQEVRASGYENAEALVTVAWTREELGKWQLAIDTWGTVKKLHGEKPLPPGDSSARTPRCAEAADFYIHKIARVRNQAADPPHAPSRRQRAKMAEAARHVGWQMWAERDEQLDLLVQVDMDGDLVEEVFAVGKYGRLGHRTDPFMCLARWDGREYEIVWRAEPKDFIANMFPVAFEFLDHEGNGWKTIQLAFEPETDNVALLEFNGRQTLLH